MAKVTIVIEDQPDGFTVHTDFDPPTPGPNLELWTEAQAAGLIAMNVIANAAKIADPDAQVDLHLGVDDPRTLL